jgi:hypothetical protein
MLIFPASPLSLSQRRTLGLFASLPLKLLLYGEFRKYHFINESSPG